jgi:hypothetical protein
VGVAGETFDTVDAYVLHLQKHLPQAYLAGIDFREYVDLLRQVETGATTIGDAVRRAPSLRRVAGSCPCSKSVRWVVEEPAGTAAGIDANQVAGG